MNKILKFIACNMIGIIIEYLIIFLFFRFILKYNSLISIIVTGIIFILMTTVTILSYREIRKHDPNIKNIKNKELLDNLVININQKLNSSFKLIYADLYKPNPAWCIGNYIYVNNNCNINIDFLPGIIAHEVGHAISKISNYTILASIKPSTFLGGVMQVTVLALIQKDHKILNIFAYFFYCLLLLVSLNNIIFVYPFLKQDEFIANSYAVKLGYGEEIRSYYGMLNNKQNTKDSNLLLKMDYLTHPSVDEMISKINQELKLKDEYQDIYFIKNKLIITYQNTITINIPSFITEIAANAFYNQNVKKITGINVVKVNTSAFYLNKELEILNLPKVEFLNINDVKRMKDLKNININNQKITFDIAKATYYLNKNLSNKLLNKLYKENFIDAINFINEKKYKTEEV